MDKTRRKKTRSFGLNNPTAGRLDLVLREDRRVRAGVIGSDVPWPDCPSSNAWVITVTENTCIMEINMQAGNLA